MKLALGTGALHNMQQARKRELKGLAKVSVRHLLRYLRRIKRAFFPKLRLGTLPFVFSVVQCLMRFSSSDYAEDVRGHAMRVGRDDPLALSVFGEYETCEAGFFEKSIQEGNVALDIGANVGYYTLLFARKVGPKGRVFAFEPEPENFQLLSDNVALNGYKNVTLVNAAVSNVPGTVRLYEPGNNALHRMFAHDNAEPSIQVESVVLDDFLAGFSGEIDFVKIDVEGAEYHVLQGMKSILSRNAQIVLAVEFCPKALALAGVEARTLIEFLGDYGFRCYEIDEGRQVIEQADIDSCLRRYTPANGYHCNLIFSRRELIGGVNLLATGDVSPPSSLA